MLATRLSVVRCLVMGCLLGFGVLSVVAQEAAYIDARGKSEIEPEAVSGVGYVRGGGFAKSPLLVEVQNMTMYDETPSPAVSWSREQVIPPPGESPLIPFGLDAAVTRTVEWTLRVTNQTATTMLIPTSLSWSNNIQVVSPERKRVLSMHIGSGPSCRLPGAPPLPAHVGFFGLIANARHASSGVELYGSANGSSDVATLEPGQWATIIGRGVGCPNPGSNDDVYRFSVLLTVRVWKGKPGKVISDLEPDKQMFVESAPLFWNGMADWKPEPLSVEHPK